MADEAYWTTVGIITTAAMGLLGKLWFWWRNKYELATQTTLEMEKANADRPWGETWRVVAELKEELARHEAKIERQSSLIDRLRTERDAAYVRAHQAQLAAQTGAAYIGKVEHLQHQMASERQDALYTEERQDAEIAELRQLLQLERDRRLADAAVSVATEAGLRAEILRLRGRDTGPLESR